MNQASIVLEKIIMGELIQNILFSCEKGDEYFETLRNKGNVCISNDVLADGMKRLFENEDDLALCALSLDRKVISLIGDIIPDELNEADRLLGLRIKKNVAMICLAISKARGKILESLSRKIVNHWYVKTVLSGFNVIAILGMLSYPRVYDYFQGPFEKKNENEESITKLCSLMEAKLNAIEKNTQQIVKDNKKYIKEFETIKIKQEKTDDRILRKSETIIQKVENRNKVERRKKLTQNLCAKIIQEKRKLYNEKREDFLKQYNIIKYYREFSVPETNSIKREIQRWERFQKTNGKDGITPPANYTRMTSELEFEAFAEKLELEKYNEWKAFITEKFLTSHNNNL